LGVAKRGGRAQKHLDGIESGLREIRDGAVAGPDFHSVSGVTDRERLDVHHVLDSFDQLHGTIVPGSGRDDCKLHRTDAADRIGDTPGSTHDRTQLLHHSRGVAIELPFFVALRDRHGREGDTGDGCVKALRFRGDLAGTSHESAHVVKTGGRIEQTLCDEAVGFTLAAHEGVELEEQCLAVQRLAAELPGAGLICRESLLAFRRSCGGDDDGCGGGVLRIFRQGTAYIDTGHIRKADVDDDEIGLRCARQLDHLFPRVRAQYGVTVGSENTLERSGRPFLIVGKKYQRWS
jgi:hypothetical protein